MHAQREMQAIANGFTFWGEKKKIKKKRLRFRLSFRLDLNARSNLAQRRPT